jgi:hypothetical protein
MALTLCDHSELFLHTLSCDLAESTMKKFCQGTLKNTDLIDHPHIDYSLRAGGNRGNMRERVRRKSNRFLPRTLYHSRSWLLLA